MTTASSLRALPRKTHPGARNARVRRGRIGRDGRCPEPGEVMHYFSDSKQDFIKCDSEGRVEVPKLATNWTPASARTRTRSTPPTLAGDPLTLVPNEDRNLIQTAAAKPLGRTAKTSKLPLEVEQYEVAGILVRQSAHCKEQNRAWHKCECWGMVVASVVGYGPTQVKPISSLRPNAALTASLRSNVY